MTSLQVPRPLPESSLWKDKATRGSYSQVIDSRRRALLLILVDQSSRFASGAVDHAGAIAEDVSTTINGCLQNLVIQVCQDRIRDRGLDIGIVGYRSDAAGKPVVQSAFSGRLAGREVVSLFDVANSPTRIATVTSWMPDDITGEMIQIPLQIPVWLETAAEGQAPICAAFVDACRLTDRWISRFPQSFPPVVWNITSGEFSDGNPWPYAQSLMQRSTTDGHVLLFHTYVSRTPGDPIWFPIDLAEMPDLASRVLFSSASTVPEPLQLWLSRWGGSGIRPSAKCVCVNADPTVMFIKGELFEFDDSRAWQSTRAGWLESQ